MKKLQFIRFLLAFLCVGCGLIAPCVQAEPSVIAFEDTNVVTMESNAVLRHHTVIVVDGQISKLGPASKIQIPKGALRVSASGHFLIPGLADMHVHAWKENLLTYIANGVTTVRFMDGHPNILRWREEISRGTLLGPTIYTVGPTIDGPSAEGTTAGTFNEGAELVIAQRSAGYDFIKVYNNVPQVAYEGIISEAGNTGIPVVGHVPFEVGLLGVIAAQQKSIEHLRGYVFELAAEDAPIRPGNTMRSRALAWNYTDRDRFEYIARLTRDAGVWNCPTLVDMQHWSLPSDKYEQLFQKEEVRFLSERSTLWLSDRSTGWLGNFAESDFQAARRALKVKKEFVGALHRAGAGILLGTDDWLRGFAIHEELQNLVDSGLSPYDAISSGTRSAAEFLGASEEFGTIKVGLRADFILLEANPLDDIENIARRVGVMVRGRWISEAMLRDMLESLAAEIREEE